MSAREEFIKHVIAEREGKRPSEWSEEYQGKYVPRQAVVPSQIALYQHLPAPSSGHSSRPALAIVPSKPLPPLGPPPAEFADFAPSEAADDEIVARWKRHKASGESVDSRLTKQYEEIMNRRELAAFDKEQEARAEAAAQSSWGPVDLTPFLDGTYSAPVPTIMPREDGQCLMYPGKTHSFHGESESCKSLLVQVEAVRLVSNGEDVLYVDFEDSPGSVAPRLVEFGAPAEMVAKHFTYINPDSKLMGTEPAWQEVLAKSYALAVIDGVTDSLSMFGLSTQDNDEIAKWQRALPRKIAKETGAAVAMIDHVTKSTEGRGRFAIGGQAKIAGLDGCAYTVTTDPTPRRGHKGTIVVRIGKDRPGNVRPHCGQPNSADRTQEAVRIDVDSTGSSPVVVWRVPSDAGSDGTKAKEVAQHVKITGAAQKLSEKLIELGQGVSKSTLKTEAGGKTEILNAALDRLERGEYISVTPYQPGKPSIVTHLKPYLAVNDGAERDLWWDWNNEPTTRQS